MKQDWRYYYEKIPPTLKNKYVVALIVFIFSVGVFDSDNIFDRIRTINEINRLEEDKRYYKKKIEETKARLDELRTNNDNLEKYAREQYFLKKENEDIFLIVEQE